MPETLHVTWDTAPSIPRTKLGWLSYLSKNEFTMSTESRLSGLEAMMQQIADAVGIKSKGTVTPKTSARVTPRREVSEMASGKGKRHEDVLLENVGGNRADGRMRLPAKMFMGRESLTVDGMKFESLETDQNRSKNFNPAIIGAEVGDDVVFVHLGGTKWESAIHHSGTKRKKGKVTVTPKTKAKTETAKPAVRGAKVAGSKMTVVKEAAKTFGLAAKKNAAKGFENENILEYTKFEDDPRQYLTSRENAQAKKVWGKRGANITLSQWVELLSEEVFD